MSPTTARTRFKISLSGLVLILAATTAHADAIQPSYTVTDLGSGYPTYATDASGHGIVIAPGGQTAYPFPQTFTGTSLPVSSTANFPVPPLTQSGDGYYSLSSAAQNVTLYPNGVALALADINAVAYGGGGWQKYEPYYVQRNPDGSSGQPVVIGPGYFHEGSPIPGDGSPGVQLALDKSGDIVVTTQSGEWPVQSDISVYNMATKTSTDITSLPALVNNGYSNPINGYSYLRLLSVNDDGRLLLMSDHQTGLTTFVNNDLLLLTPAGVSSDPIAMNAPEPGSLAVMAMALVAFAAHRARKRI